MQARLASIFARPRGTGSDKPHTGPVGVIVHAPYRGEEHLDVCGREELGLTVRPIEHADLPLFRISRRHHCTQLRGRAVSICQIMQVYDISRAQRATSVAAKAAEHESSACCPENAAHQCRRRWRDKRACRRSLPRPNARCCPQVR